MRGANVTEDPSIGHRFAMLKENVGNTFHNPLGAYTTADVRDKQVRSTERAIDQEEGAAKRASVYDANQQNNARKLALAGLTAPQLVQTGGTGTSQQSGGLAQALIGGAASVGSAALM